MPKIAVVHAGQEEFGIDINSVVEILKAQRIHLIPHLPSFLSGMVNIRGEVIPLVDLRKRFGIHASSTSERIVVVRTDHEKVGLLVDSVKEIVNLEPHEISAPPSVFKGLRTDYLIGIGKKGESIIILLNLDRLLTSEEKIQLEETARTVEVNRAGDEKASQ
jgi:purine-binding chemotaxis protein CheW